MNSDPALRIDLARASLLGIVVGKLPESPKHQEFKMKKILVAAALLAGMSFAQDAEVRPVRTIAPILMEKGDSLRKLDSALMAQKRAEFHATMEEQRAKDSAMFANRLPDSLRSRIEARVRDFKSHKASFDSAKDVDSARIAGFKLKADSLRKSWEAKRDSQVANIRDTAVQAKVRARIAEISAQREAIKAKIEARKATLEAKRAELKAKIEAAKAEEATTTTP